MNTYQRFDPHVIEQATALAATAPPRKRPILRRVYDAFLHSQMLRARREVDRKLGSGAFARACLMELPPEK